MAANAPIKISWRHPIRKIDTLTAEKAGLRKLANALKYIFPPATMGVAAALFLLAPGAATVGGLLFYMLLSGGLSTAASRGLSKSFKIAKLEREATSGLSADLNFKVELDEARRSLRDANERCHTLATEKSELERQVEELEALKGKSGRDVMIFDGRMFFIRELGRGGMAIAFLSFDTAMGQVGVCKVPLPDTLQDVNALERFRNEARVMAQLQDQPNIVKVRDMKDVTLEVYEELTGVNLARMGGGSIGLERVPYIVMEYIFPPTTLEKKAASREDEVLGREGAELYCGARPGALSREEQRRDPSRRETGQYLGDQYPAG